MTSIWPKVAPSCNSSPTSFTSAPVGSRLTRPDSIMNIISTGVPLRKRNSPWGNSLMPSAFTTAVSSSGPRLARRGRGLRRCSIKDALSWATGAPKARLSLTLSEGYFSSSSLRSRSLRVHSTTSDLASASTERDRPKSKSTSPSKPPAPTLPMTAPSSVDSSTDPDSIKCISSPGRPVVKITVPWSCSWRRSRWTSSSLSFSERRLKRGTASISDSKFGFMFFSYPLEESGSLLSQTRLL